MKQKANEIVNIKYEQTGRSSDVNELGMREMQAKAYAARDKRFLLIKAPPASGKSRALMFIALDKLQHQGIKRVVVAVPEKSIGRSFQNTRLKPYGFFADWNVANYFNLTDVKNEKDKKGRFIEFFRQKGAKILVCAHATLRNAMKEMEDEWFNDTLLAIDEFHHTSADAESNLGDVVRRVMNNSTGHIVAMTGSYFRGDGVPVLRQEDEARFFPVTYNYYEQLNGYRYMKNLVLGYHFYHGSYLDHIMEVLDTTKKTIIHIPSINSRASTGLKYDETDQIMRLIGRRVDRDYNTGIYTVETPDGRLLRIADLVEDDPKERNRVQGFLQKMKRRDDVDIIIALGTAKEGFDWQWCEMCLTIGVRGSLTEVIQIIGRCTRDCEGKETARFVNMIAMPDAEQADVKVAVNDFLKAITASLLMEQVMAPSWNFKTAADIDDDDNNRKKNTVVIEGLKPLTSVRAKQIVEEQLDDLKADVLNNDLVVRAISGSTTAETITKVLIPKVIRERYPDLNDEEVEMVREHFLADTLIKGSDIVVEDTIIRRDERNAEDGESEGNRLIKLANRFVNIDKLSINLIDTINPFQRAYEVLSKTVDAPTLRIIQDTIAEQKFDLTMEQAIMIFKGPFKAYVEEHGGNIPQGDDPDPKVREMAAAYQMLRNLKARKMAGLEYEE
ncbi:DEAD/DEAH box helicase [Prevotella sp. P2-180]|uniref:DEAD/DEAH box helicase n=1 Tax=Prevotella sp. P2-180 TaxID=2024224 RepID=UPI000B97C334|nr:DEAD/DEAH box helicase [Prevotella sp. P2-180]OYP61556.1 ATP-dependent helicase [Prevotella sp. P2-180]